jgi:hypothetical protein
LAQLRSPAWTSGRSSRKDERWDEYQGRRHDPAGAVSETWTRLAYHDDLALSPTHFSDETARRGIAHNDQKARGRTLYCVSAAEHGSHERGQVVAALSWHVDERKSAPILITNLAIRGDSLDARTLSLAAAAWTLAYLLEVAAQTGRPDEVGVEIDTQPNREDFRAIGFRAATTPVAYSSPYWAFRAPF